MGSIASAVSLYLSPPPPPTFHLLTSLPLELRVKIYTLALPTSQYLPFGPGPYFPNLESDHLLISVPALCRSSRQLRAETLSIFHGENSFSMALKASNFASQVAFLDRCFDDEKAALLRQMFIKEDEFTVVVSLFRNPGEGIPRTRPGGGLYKLLPDVRDRRINWDEVEQVWSDIERCKGRRGKGDSGARRRHIARLMAIVGRDLGFYEDRPRGLLARLCESGEPGFE